MPDNRHDGLVASLRRTRLVAAHTLGAALRMRLTELLGLTGAGLVAAAWWLREFNFGTAELKFIADFGLGALGFLGTLLAALVTSQLFFNGLAGGAAYCVLTRPVRRGEYLAGHLAGIAALLALFCAAMGGLVAGLLVWRGAQLGATAIAWPVFGCACAWQWLKLTLVAAMTLLVCSYAGSALFASCAGMLLALAAHLRPLAHAGGRLGWFRVWPNLALFDAESLVASGQLPSGAVVLGLIGYWTLYVGLYGGLATYVFKRREF